MVGYPVNWGIKKMLYCKFVTVLPVYYARNSVTEQRTSNNLFILEAMTGKIVMV